jgi:hypothetical protein
MSKKSSFSMTVPQQLRNTADVLGEDSPGCEETLRKRGQLQSLDANSPGRVFSRGPAPISRKQGLPFAVLLL